MVAPSSCRGCALGIGHISDAADALGLCRFPRTRLPLSEQGIPSERRPVAPHETGCPTYTVPPQAPAAAPACCNCGDALDAKSLKGLGKTRCTGCGHWAIG